MNDRRERQLLELFDIGLLLKAAGGAIEIAGSFLVLFMPRAIVARIADLVTQGELTGDSDDFVGTHLRELAHQYAVHAHYLLASFLFLDGVLKIALVILVFKRYRYAFPIFIGGIALLAMYEAYRGVRTNNLFLDAIVVLDILLIMLAAHEAKRRAARA